MIVKKFEFKDAWYQYKRIWLKEFFINNIKISNNFCEYELENDMLQIDICDECFSVGCSLNDYVQEIVCDKFIIWKEPLIAKEPYKDFVSASAGLEQGTIIWPKNLYLDLLRKFEVKTRKDLNIKSNE